MSNHTTTRTPEGRTTLAVIRAAAASRHATSIGTDSAIAKGEAAYEAMLEVAEASAIEAYEAMLNAME